MTAKRRVWAGRGTVIGMTVGVLAALTACTPSDPTPPNVILITIDTLRADRLGLYGYPRPTSPHIDSLAEESVVFDAAVPTCPATAPSVASILTGHHRATHGVVRNGAQLREGVETLAEALQAEGYRTAGVIANPALVESLGFGQGFERYGTPDSIVSAGPGRFGGEPVVARALADVDAMSPGPFFLWIHFMDPHGAYYPPEEDRALFDPKEYVQPGDAPLPLLEGNHGLGAIPRYQRLSGQRTDQLIDPADLRARYDAEIHYVDRHVGAVIRGLQERGLWKDSLFVLTADHGESLGEHDYYFQHGFYPYEDTLNVPLLIRSPGRVPQGLRVSGSMSLLDLAPTILDLARLRGLEGSEGRSAVPMIEGREGDRTAFAVTYYGNRLVTLRRGSIKYVYTPPPPAPENDRRKGDGWRSYWPLRESQELYDLSSDPGEVARLEEVRPELTARLRAEVAGWLGEQLERGDQWEDSPARKVLDPELQTQLRALGYID